MPQLPLAIGSMAAGAVLTIAGTTGSSLASVVQGHPDHKKAVSAHPTSSSNSSAAASETGSQPGGSETGLPAAALKKLRSIAKAKGWSESAWLGVISRESGGDPTATNKSTGAYGIGQINPENAGDPLDPRPGSTASEYPKYKGNAVEQIEAMAEYIEGSYGDPSKALESEETRGWY